MLISSLDVCPEFTITYFVPDDKKEGGKYITSRSTLKKLNKFEKNIPLENGAQIPFDNIIQIYFDE